METKIWPNSTKPRLNYWPKFKFKMVTAAMLVFFCTFNGKSPPSTSATIFFASFQNSRWPLSPFLILGEWWPISRFIFQFSSSTRTDEEWSIRRVLSANWLQLLNTQSSAKSREVNRHTVHPLSSRVPYCHCVGRLIVQLNNVYTRPRSLQ